MRLEGSCHCGAVRFTADSPHPVPYQRCYCSICRKTAGAGGFAINIAAEIDDMVIEGRDNVSIYKATEGTERAFCRTCGSALWVFSRDWPNLIHPHASVIDTDLPVPEEHTHAMLAFRAEWAVPQVEMGDRTSDDWPDQSIAEWHHRTGTTE